MMIKKANKTHISRLVELWSEAFGDNEADILNYLEYLLNFFYVYEENGEVNAMAAVLPVAYRNKNGGYIYAVATRKSAQGRGLSTALLNYIKSLDNYEFLVLVPQNEGLFEFYEKRGFIPFSSVVTKEICAGVVTCNDICCEEISTEEYFNLRKEFFGDKLIEWGTEVLNFARKMYSGRFYRVEDNANSVACFCFKNGERLVIKEILGADREQVGKKLAVLFGAKYACLSYPDFAEKPSAMFYPAVDSVKYFSIALD